MFQGIVWLLFLIPPIGETDDHQPVWTYNRTGPSDWAHLSEDYRDCGQGREQSPIDISDAISSELPKLRFEYRQTPLTVHNKNRTVKVEVEPGSFLVSGNERFQLVEFHFHAPSEHTIDGRHAPMELHLVHHDPELGFAVVGIMLEIGTASPLLDLIWNQLPADPRVVIKSPLKIDPGSLIPEEKSYFRYDGSLTTPPCTQKIRWHLLRTPIHIRREQYDLFLALFGENARPIQPLNDRKIRVGGE